METDIDYQQGHVYALKASTEISPPRDEGLHSFDHRIERELPSPMVVESAATYYDGATRGHEADVEVLDTVPSIHPWDDDECRVSIVCSYKLHSGTHRSSRHNNGPELEFQHQILYRDADDIRFDISG